jgi:prolyl-tRNA editing enzyme YbaK/EbsC (Cys-tRNA(Pro) deacylase)
MEWPEQVERVAAALRAAAVDARLEEFSRETPTAEAAARAVGCDLRQIVKSLVFVCDGDYVLALVPGDRRADETRVAAAAESSSARIATGEEVVAATGFDPGAVAPFPVPGVSLVLLERTLLDHDLVWIGAGSPRPLAGLAPADLQRIAHADQADLTG